MRITRICVSFIFILHGDSRDSLIANPQDIVYVESIANYLNIFQ